MGDIYSRTTSADALVLFGVTGDLDRQDRHPGRGLAATQSLSFRFIHYLFSYRPKWRPQAAVGKTVVSSQMIDRVTAKVGRKLYEVPVGFKWIVDGLLGGSLGFGSE